MYRFSRVDQEVYQIQYRLIILFVIHFTVTVRFDTDNLLYFHSVDGVGRKLGAGRALQRLQHMGHAHGREYHVVHAKRTGLIHVEGAQVGVNPVGTTYPGNQRQIGGRSAKPFGRILVRHRVFHQIADLGTIDDQVGRHQIFRNTDVCRHPVVTLVLGAVTAKAVVHEGGRATLQRRLVVQVVVGLVQVHSPGVGKHQRRQQGQHCKNYSFHLNVTLSGSGLVLSFLL